MKHNFIFKLFILIQLQCLNKIFCYESTITNYNINDVIKYFDEIDYEKLNTICAASIKHVSLNKIF